MAPLDRKTRGEQVLSAVNLTVLVLLTVLFLYPMWYCLMASFSDANSLIGYRGFLFTPLGFSSEGYTTVFKNRNILTGYGNTLLYTCVGTIINVMLTALGGYCLSRKNMMLRRVVTLVIVFTMYVDFGLIPAFLNVRSLHLYNTRWALLLPGAINTYNLIVMRTAFLALPPSLEESAMLDGANDITILFRILLPLTKATLAVVTLFYAVGHWNDYFNAMIYVSDREKWTLQLLLREILISTQSGTDGGADVSEAARFGRTLKMATVFTAIIPIMMVYPFVQKYFVKGVMVGAVKG